MMRPIQLNPEPVKWCEIGISTWCAVELHSLGKPTYISGSVTVFAGELLWGQKVTDHVFQFQPGVQHLKIEDNEEIWVRDE
jgi:hypothetical protein